MIPFPIQVEITGKTATLLKEFTLAGVTVPVGFNSDGISSPRITWVKWHPFAKPLPAAFVHDYCIANHSYAVARDRFKQALVELALSGWEVFILYHAVRFRDWTRRVYTRYQR